MLAESNESNIAKLGLAGACETIPIIIQAHQNSEHVVVVIVIVIAIGVVIVVIFFINIVIFIIIYEH